MPPTNTNKLLDAAEAHFVRIEVTDGKSNNIHFSCKFCKREFHCSRSRLPYHLSGESGHDIKPCKSVTLTVRNEISSLLSKNSEEPILIEDQEQQGTIPALWDVTRRKQADARWAEFVYAEHLPFLKLRSPFLKAALEASSGIPGYLPPGPKALAGKLLDEANEKVQDILKKKVIVGLPQTGDIEKFLLI